MALNCLVFEKIAFLQLGDRQINRQTNIWTRPSHEAALAVASGGLIRLDGGDCLDSERVSSCREPAVLEVCWRPGSVRWSQIIACSSTSLVSSSRSPCSGSVSCSGLMTIGRTSGGVSPPPRGDARKRGRAVVAAAARLTAACSAAAAAVANWERRRWRRRRRLSVAVSAAGDLVSDALRPNLTCLRTTNTPTRWLTPTHLLTGIPRS